MTSFVNEKTHSLVSFCLSRRLLPLLLNSKRSAVLLEKREMQILIIYHGVLSYLTGSVRQATIVALRSGRQATIVALGYHSVKSRILDTKTAKNAYIRQYLDCRPIEEIKTNIQSLGEIIMAAKNTTPDVSSGSEDEVSYSETETETESDSDPSKISTDDEDTSFNVRNACNTVDRD